MKVMRVGGAFEYQGANQDAVSPSKLAALIHTFEGDYPRINIDNWGKSLHHDQSTMRPRRMTSGGSMQGDWSFLKQGDEAVRKMHGDKGSYGLKGPIMDFFMRNGGLMERAYGISSHLFPDEINKMKSGGKWIQGAVNPAHKGYCTPMTKSTCTGRRRAFALTMKKHHGFHKKAEGGFLDGPGDPKLMREGDPKFRDAYAHNQFYINRAKEMLSPEQRFDFENQNKDTVTGSMGKLNPQQQYSQDLGYLASKFDFPQFKEPQDYRLALYKSLQPGGTPTPVPPKRSTMSAGLARGGKIKSRMSKFSKAAC